jgi:hypothetical protein
MIRPKSFVAAELKKETENDTSIVVLDVWCEIDITFSTDQLVYMVICSAIRRLKMQACQLP